MGGDNTYFLFLLGLIIIIVTLLRLFWQRVRQNTEKQRQRETALKMAQEAERKTITQTNLPPSKRAMPQTRVPLGNSLGTPFTGAIQGQAARWEAEIHQLGRQIIGQIDSKMAALQAITLDANRTANRLEILVEHLEEIARMQITRIQTAEQQENASSPNDSSNPNSPDEAPAESPPTVIPATESALAATPLAEMLQELTEDIDDFRRTVGESTSLRSDTKPDLTERPERASVLRMEEVPVQDLRGEVEMLANYGLEPQEIAQRLNLSAGEVDLILQIQQNRTE